MSLLLSTLPVRHWRVYTEGKVCIRCLPKAIEWVNDILEIYHESIINCVDCFIVAKMSGNMFNAN